MTRKWLRPLGLLTRWIAYACLFWLWWIGVASFDPNDENLNDGWTYLGSGIVLIIIGTGLFMLARA